MTEQEQIEEMTEEIEKAKQHIWASVRTQTEDEDYLWHSRAIAEHLTSQGYQKIDMFAECRNCTAWSGTDCTRHPYTQGCLKDENNIKWQAVKEFAEKLKNKLFDFFQDNEELDGKISVGPLYVDVIGVEAKDGTIISLGLIDRLLKEYVK